MADRNTVLSESSYSKVYIGEILVGQAPDVMVTVLGSCVAIVLYDEYNRIGGLSHVMLANSKGSASVRNKGRYADTAIPEMIKMSVKKGANLGGMVARITGGAAMYEVSDPCSNIGKCNVDAVKSILLKNNIPIVGEDVGGKESRTVKFDLNDGKITVYSAGQKKATI